MNYSVEVPGMSLESLLPENICADIYAVVHVSPPHRAKSSRSVESSPLTSEQGHRFHQLADFQLLQLGSRRIDEVDTA